MELDTGAAASIMSEETFLRIWAKSDGLKPVLLPINKALEIYTGESIHFKQYGSVTVLYNEQKRSLPLFTGKTQFYTSRQKLATGWS